MPYLLGALVLVMKPGAKRHAKPAHDHHGEHGRGNQGTMIRRESNLIVPAMAALPRARRQWCAPRRPGPRIAS